MVINSLGSHIWGRAFFTPKSINQRNRSVFNLLVIIKMTSISPSVHVTYGSQTFISNSTRSEFLNKVCEKYGLNKDEIEIYDVETCKAVGVRDLRDFMKVEIRKKNHPPINRTSRRGYPSNASTSKIPNLEVLNKKLLDNSALNGLERAFLIECVKNFSNPLKRKNDAVAVNQDAHREMKNRKVQVSASNLIANRTTSTQTDELINYQPPLNNTTLTNDIIVQSKRLAASEKVDLAKASDLMVKSFDKRRNFILIERPAVSFVKEKFPLLFSCTEVCKELDRIFYDGKCQEFISNIEKYAPHILSAARDDDPLLRTTQEKMKLYETSTQRKYAQEVGAILMVSSLMHEKRNYLKLLDHHYDISNFPYIETLSKLDEIFFDQHIYKVYAENLLLCEASDLKEALLCLIASYFIFNIKYPDTSFRTFVVFEKLFLEASDTDENEIDVSVTQIIRSIQLKQQARGR
ncbi:DUF5641 domain-containing protein [Trichonephila inaurata madagascariensis]|uniref:DUF5641 domain-containing protein n=1 Tax=Trichonephila inaurata madagascariensis TaxID=2747483 RepID=A0A8X7BZ57_9ARAC|nr:DUF5641 domain-containing protein [Trichonephila inaurata madagascariensis]